MSYYDILGVDKTATDQQIKMAYFNLAKTHHPDVKSSENEESINFEMINEAYQTLKTEKSRKLYDRTGLSADDQKQGGMGYDFGESARRNFNKRVEDYK